MANLTYKFIPHPKRKPTPENQRKLSLDIHILKLMIQLLGFVPQNALKSLDPEQVKHFLKNYQYRPRLSKKDSLNHVLGEISEIISSLAMLFTFNFSDEPERKPSPRLPLQPQLRPQLKPQPKVEKGLMSQPFMFFNRKPAPPMPGVPEDKLKLKRFM